MIENIEQSRISEIVTLHSEVANCLRMSVEKAIRIGELLTAQKASLQHGEFLPWIKANLPFTDRTARNYMAFYTNRNLLKTETVSDFKSAYAAMSLANRAPNDVIEPSVLPAGDRTNITPDIETRIRKGVNAELQHIFSQINQAREQTQKKIRELVKSLELMTVSTEELNTLSENSDTYDLKDVVVQMEKLCEKFGQAGFQDVQLMFDKASYRLSKILENPINLLGCKTVITSQGLKDPQTDTSLPIWGCGVHSDCQEWHGWGWEAGPAETHIRGLREFNQAESGICDTCKQENLKLYVMAASGDLMCPECYLDTCLEIDRTARVEIQEAIEMLGISDTKLVEVA